MQICWFFFGEVPEWFHRDTLWSSNAVGGVCASCFTPSICRLPWLIVQLLTPLPSLVHCDAAKQEKHRILQRPAKVSLTGLCSVSCWTFLKENVWKSKTMWKELPAERSCDVHDVSGYKRSFCEEVFKLEMCPMCKGSPPLERDAPGTHPENTAEGL